METRALLLTFLLEIEISSVAVQSIHQNSENGDFCGFVMNCLVKMILRLF